MAILGIIALLSTVLSVRFAMRADWSVFGLSIREKYDRIGKRGQAAATACSAAIVAITGFLTWGEQAAGLYRRVGDGGQLALTAAAASIFYLAPSFVLYLLALVILFVLLYLRPAWGLALVAFSIPYYVNPKSLLGYRFSPVEIFLLLTLIAFLATLVVGFLKDGFAPADRWRLNLKQWNFKLKSADLAVLAFMIVATLSLLITDRLDVATNEWRVVIIEPVIFYYLLRLIPFQEKEMWTVIDAFILGGLFVAIIGLAQYIGGQNLITSEGGLMRLRSIYGSPNNVALYLGRLLPIVLAVALMGMSIRRLMYGLALVPIGLAILLTFSKGALFLGLPVSILIVVVLWRRAKNGRIWPWLVGAGILAALALLVAAQIPQLAGRLNPQGTTGLFRFHLWLAAINMFLDHPILGVGLDNFLYAYRGRYIFEAAWQEPNLSHPHNIVLDFATRLGLLGLVAGAWMIWAYWRTAYKLPVQVPDRWKPIAISLLGSLSYILVHGLVDHSFFLVDLAYSFLLLLAIAVWLEKTQIASPVRNLFE
jgi:O-antigen ligase